MENNNTNRGDFSQNLASGETSIAQDMEAINKFIGNLRANRQEWSKWKTLASGNVEGVNIEDAKHWVEVLDKQYAETAKKIEAVRVKAAEKKKAETAGKAPENNSRANSGNAVKSQKAIIKQAGRDD